MTYRAFAASISSFVPLALFVLLGPASDASFANIAPEPTDQVVGFYSDGALRNASMLSREGQGYIHLFHVRNRYWGTAGLVELTEYVAAQMTYEFPDGERLQVGDLSARDGGPITLHASHQNGLDIDMVYFRVNRKEQADDPARGFTENFVLNGRISKNFDTVRNWRLFELLVGTGRVQRIFLDPAIKQLYCRKYVRVRTAQEVLRRLRPYANHGDHIHVRLTCPVESPECIVQEEVPAGSGC